MFWKVIQSLRKTADRYSIQYESVRAILRRRSTHELIQFSRELGKRVRDLATWEQWAVGSILGGPWSAAFAENYFFWILLQGEEFTKAVLRDPRHAATEAPSDDPSCPFYFSPLGFVPNQILATKTGDLGGRDQRDELKSSDLKGKPWVWTQLANLHPDLWEAYFLKRDRRLKESAPGKISDEFVYHVANPVWSWLDIYDGVDYYQAQIRQLGADQLGLTAVLRCDAECQNGGIDQFFHNSTGIVAQEALDGFHRFGAKEHARRLSRVMKAFPGGSPSRDRKFRQQQMKKRWGEEIIDDEFRTPGGLPELEPILARYIRAHPDAFFRKP